MGWPTAQTVITQAALELGLIQSDGEWGDDVYGSLDGTVAQFRALLKKAGRGLVDEADWSHLRAEYSILTQSIAVAAAVGHPTHQRWGAYMLPPDWRSMVDQSGWNRTSRLPMGGPLSEQEWQYLASRLTGVVFTVLFRPMQGLLYLYPSAAIPDAQAITMAYKSSRWVQPASLYVPAVASPWAALTNYTTGAVVYDEGGSGGVFVQNVYRCVQNGKSALTGPDVANTATGTPTTSGVIVDGTVNWNWIGCFVQSANPDQSTTTTVASFGTSDVPGAGTDLLMFDEDLLVAKLKMMWLKAKGFDSSDAEDDYARTFAQAASNDSPSPILSLNGTGIVRDRLLGALNVPITGFGS